MTSERPILIIAGGGLAGGLAALALAERRPDVRFLLIEQAPSFGGNHVWSFFDSDVDPSDRALLEPLIVRRWADHEVRFPRRRRRLALGYNSASSDRLDRHLRARLDPRQYRLGCAIDHVAADHVVAGGERIEAEAVIDARGALPAAGLELAWQKFVGCTYRLPGGHGVPRPVIMDALVDQAQGYRFVYSLPFAADELMIEDTFYSESAEMDRAALAAGLDGMAAGFGPAERIGIESGVLPILLDGELEALWPRAGPAIARLGMRGGFFHPTTGYSLPDAACNANLLAGQSDLRGESLYRFFRDRSERLWDERHFFQLLNRMLFRAAEPAERFRVLEHFYRLPLPTIARFYGARLTAFDKVRILSGKPPVPIRRALGAMRSKAA